MKNRNYSNGVCGMVPFSVYSWGAVLAFVFLLYPLSLHGEVKEGEPQTAPSVNTQEPVTKEAATQIAETIISGGDVAAAKALRMATADEKTAYWVCPIVLSRLSECKETLDKNTLLDESTQPNWWCHFNDIWWGRGAKTREEFIIACFADVLRETSSCDEKYRLREIFFETITKKIESNNSNVNRGMLIASAEFSVLHPTYSLIPEEGLDQLVSFLQHVKTVIEIKSRIWKSGEVQSLLREMALIYIKLATDVYERREEFWLLSKQCENFDQDDTRETAFQNYEHVSMSWYKEIQTKSGTEIAGLLLTCNTRTERYILLDELIGTRIKRCENWELIWPKLIQKKEILFPVENILAHLAKPYPSNANVLEQKHFKEMLEYFKEIIKNTQPKDSGPEYIVDYLGRLIIDKKTVNEIYLTESLPNLDEPYGYKDVLDVFQICLKSGNFDLVISSVDVLGIICFLNLKTAYKVKEMIDENRSSISEIDWSSLTVTSSPNKIMKLSIKIFDKNFEKAIITYTKQ